MICVVSHIIFILPADIYVVWPKESTPYEVHGYCIPQPPLRSLVCTKSSHRDGYTLNRDAESRGDSRRFPFPTRIPVDPSPEVLGLGAVDAN